MDYDIFISHASEDKEEVARPLAEHLKSCGLRVWLDASELTLGDSLRRSIDRGLAGSRFGVLVLSPAFFRKEWPKKELDGLVAREDGREKVILPVWHNVSREDIVRFSAPLADRIGVPSSHGLEHVAKEIRIAISRAADTGDAVQHQAAQTPMEKTAVTIFATSPEQAVADIKAQFNKALVGQYTIEAMVQRGEISIIFRAWDQVLHRRVALQVLDPYKVALEPGVTERFHKAMQPVADFKHRNIVAVYTARQDAPLPYIVLEFVTGARLDRVIQSTGVQPFRKVRDFIIHIGSALNYAHRKGYLHHNLRPTNIFVDKEGYPVISPFRIIDTSGASSGRNDRPSFETIKYQSPEQYFEVPLSAITEASDQYTLGLIAYEMLIGRPVIASETLVGIAREKEVFMQSTPDIRKDRPDCPEDLANVILRMLNRQPTERWPHLDDAFEKLHRLNIDGKLRPKSKMHQMMHEAMRSFDRCRNAPTFFEDFYNRFFGLYPEIRGKFLGDLEIQYYLLRESLDLILQFPTESTTEPTTLSKVAETHRARGITSALYDSFTDILIETVKKHDPMCRRSEELSRQIVNAWETTVKPAICYMQARAKAIG
jgi:serine/threonine protein kinase